MFISCLSSLFSIASIFVHNAGDINLPSTNLHKLIVQVRLQLTAGHELKLLLETIRSDKVVFNDRFCSSPGFPVALIAYLSEHKLRNDLDSECRCPY